MNKGELVKALAARSETTQKEADKLVTALCEIIIEVVADGDSVIIAGFGKFAPAIRQAREGRNPKTGKAMKIPAARVPRFVAGKLFKGTVNF